MADGMSGNLTWKENFDIYLRKFVIYVGKNPREFVSYVVVILSPMMLICGYLSWKLIQLTNQEEKEKKRKGKINSNIAKIRRKKKAKPE
ncbi:small integral membrane protein 15-like [Xenia sp. Carnegie-2017]|uniref:small integral membrane protein 15-like n=1 Tax=Xenia sp. Carnegie-2017 TaxID=2897299 RepID=UPI001F04561C|nr:small integral membrane protein 15-like [Xenia sp. Carnegie-2017]